MNKNIQSFKLLVVAFIIALSACKEQKKFSYEKWNYSPDSLYPPPDREKTLKDLTTNYKLVGLTCSQLEKLLGETSKESNKMYYNLKIEYGFPDPVYTENLVFEFSKDSIVTSFKIEEWEED